MPPVLGGDRADRAYAPAMGGTRAREARVYTLAGDGFAGCTDGSGPEVCLTGPRGGIAVDAEGYVFLADQEHHCIRRIAPDGTVLTIAGCGKVHPYVDGPGAMATFNGPRGVAIAPDGTLYVADQLNHRIRCVKSDGTVSTLQGPDGAPLVVVLPQSVAVDRVHTVYIAHDRDVVWAVATDGRVTHLAGEAAPEYAIRKWRDRDEVDTFRAPPREADLALVPTGHVYGAIAVNAAGQVIAGDGRLNVVRVAGEGALAGTGRPAYNDGAALDAAFRRPQGVAVGPDGRVYVADTDNHRVRVIANGQVTTLAGSGRPGAADGPGPTASFRGPLAVALGPTGVVYVADAGNHRVRAIVPAPLT